MRIRSRFVKIALVLAMLLYTGFITQVQANPRINVFYDALAPYGEWVNHPTYGQVWYPHDVAQDWRPYTDGYWAHTDDYGWLWVANEPWGWAPFHYGRWAWDNWYGWLWVPGQTWAPAWVFWRSGGGYAAWAPMPPNVIWQPGIGLNISYFNYERDLSWDCWVAVREYDLSHRHLNRHIFPSNRNRQIMNATDHSRNITLINNTIVNQGVPVKQIEASTRKPIISVSPKVRDRLDIHRAEHGEGRPTIIRLPMAGPTPEEIHHHEELARQLDGKIADGTGTALSTSRLPGNQEPRMPGRLARTSAHSPNPQPERLKPVPAAHGRGIPSQPETSQVPSPVDADAQNKEHKVDRRQQSRAPDQQASEAQPTVKVPAQTDGVKSNDRQPVSKDAAALPPLQNQSQPLEAHDVQPLPAPVADQRNAENLPRHLKAQNQPQILEHASPDAQAVQQQEAARQQELQKQQHMEAQRQQAEQARRDAQAVQQQEAARQQERQSQQQMKTQRQQAEQARQDAQALQQQETARQQERQSQQRMEAQRQQAEQARQDVQAIQQQEHARKEGRQRQKAMRPGAELTQ